ncbi:MAG TPA: alpha/beta fold hydrolase [Candidatus Babeliales bacterium]|nr:alpha/beta fold hydrolase [Candidatus Babeliales bacterium]
MNTRRAFRIIITSVIISFALIGGVAYRTIRSTVYRFSYSPEAKQQIEKNRAFLIEHYHPEQVHFTTCDNITLSGLFIPRKHAKRAILICHGYGMSKELMRRFVSFFPHDSILLFDFRAHGESGGHVITIGNHEQWDVQAAVDFLHAQPETARLPIVGVGVSMGGATLLGAAAHGVNFQALIIDSSFGRLCDQVSHAFYKYTGLPRFLFMPAVVFLFEYLAGASPTKVVPVEFISKIHCPVLVVHSLADEMTPATIAQELFEAAHEPKELWLVKGSKHGFIRRDYPEEYAHKIEHFLHHYT